MCDNGKTDTTGNCQTIRREEVGGRAGSETKQAGKKAHELLRKTPKP